MLLLAIVLALAVASICAILALVEVSKLMSEASTSNFQQNQSSCCVSSDVEALQQEFSMFQQNVSETDGSIITSLGRNSEDQLQLRHNYSLLYSEVQQLRTGLRCSSSISTCASLDPLCPSGYYQVELSNGSAVPVYCDMALSCGAVTGGWMRVAELNMTDTSQQCPNGLVERDSSGTRRCEIDDFSSGCFPTMYSTLNVSYTKVCGRITAYQVGSY